MSFYHKYRPQNFNDLAGQDHVRKTLTNALCEGKVGHAYLFSGPRGVGKTTAARLLAKSLNCEKRKDSSYRSKNFEPCNECSSCKEIMLDKSLDVIEIDAASNRGIDEIRELREKIKFAPNHAKYKVYIIDEVHMLTKEAFNALLKTLEEPPKHVIFIMATTELHKIPATILSRVQSFNFKRASIDGITDYLKRIINNEKIALDEKTLRLIAIAGEGSYRDATSVLDQVASLGGNNISLKDVQEILGITEEKAVYDFLDFIFSGSEEKALGLINQIFSEGYDLEDFTKKVIEYLRRLMIFKANPGYFNANEFTQEQKKSLEYLSPKIEKSDLLETLGIFLEALINIKGSSIPQLPLELAIMEMENITGKLVKSEKIAHANPIKDISPEPQKDERNENEVKNQVPEIYPLDKKSVDTITIQKKWPEVLGKIQPDNRSLYLILKECEPREIKDGKLFLAVKFKIYEERITAKKNYKVLAEALESVLGKSHQLDFLVDENIKVNGLNIEQDDRKDEKSENIENKNDKDLMKDALDVFEI